VQQIRYRREGRIAYIMLDISDMNPINFDAVSELHDVWDDFRRNDDAWVAILGSETANFSVGFDIRDIKKMLDAGGFSWENSCMFGNKRLGPDQHGVTKPIVAAVNGIVNGAGLWLVLQADIRIATHNTLFGLGEAKLNFPVEFSGLLTRYMPRAIVNEMLFTSRPLSAQRFYELGILNRITDKVNLMAEATGMAESICDSGPMSIETMKELVQMGYETDYQELMAVTAEKVVQVVNSQDTREAIDCFLTKRRPGWKKK